MKGIALSLYLLSIINGVPQDSYIYDFYPAIHFVN